MASKKEKLTGALSRIRTCDPPLRRRMLYPTELPGHKDIVPEPKVCPIRVPPDPSREPTRKGSLNQNLRCARTTSSLCSANNQPGKDVKPEPKVCPIRVQPVPSQQPARIRTLNQIPRCLQSTSILLSVYI